MVPQFIDDVAGAASRVAVWTSPFAVAVRVHFAAGSTRSGTIPEAYTPLSSAPYVTSTTPASPRSCESIGGGDGADDVTPGVAEPVDAGDAALVVSGDAAGVA
ncbi:hypothetical protein ACEYYH_06480 [Microbacterium trichothecenolyticum]|uniref:hypothetical protein n=1 Tax=Microbacterium trichothecenolyticum TaxID=69370 RepID=UPI0035BE8C2E